MDHRLVGRTLLDKAVSEYPVHKYAHVCLLVSLSGKLRSTSSQVWSKWIELCTSNGLSISVCEDNSCPSWIVEDQLDHLHSEAPGHKPKSMSPLLAPPVSKLPEHKPTLNSPLAAEKGGQAPEKEPTFFSRLLAPTVKWSASLTMWMRILRPHSAHSDRQQKRSRKDEED